MVIEEVDLLRDGSGRNYWQNVGDQQVNLLSVFCLSNSQTDALSIFGISSSSVDKWRMESMDIVVFSQENKTLIRGEVPFPIVTSLVSQALKYYLSSSNLGLQSLTATMPFSVKMTALAHFINKFFYFLLLGELSGELGGVKLVISFHIMNLTNKSQFINTRFHSLTIISDLLIV